MFYFFRTHVLIDLNKTKQKGLEKRSTILTQHKNNNIYNRYFLDKLQSQNKTSKSL